MPRAVRDLSPAQHLAIRYLAGGSTPGEVAEKLRMSPATITGWRQLPLFKKELSVAVAEHSDLVTAVLLHGERKAAETLIGALHAETPQGKPHWLVRVDAAKSLLDRSGKRGKAIDRQQVAVADVTNGDMGKEIVAALRDPGVRAWLAKEPALLHAVNNTVSAPDLVEAEILLPAEEDDEGT